MRGSPVLHCLFIALAFAAFAVPLARLTVARPAAPALQGPVAREKPAETGGRPTVIRLRFAHAPVHCSLQHGGRELVPAGTTWRHSPVEWETTLPEGREGLELSLNARWEAGVSDTAITVELEPDELETRRETRWSGGSALNEILFFQW